MATVFQGNLFTEFLYPFLLMFFIVFAILEKTSILGKEKKSINAVVSLVIGLIFVGAVFPKFMAENMILFLTVGMMVIFVALMLWGFITGEGEKGFTFQKDNKTVINKFLFYIILIAIVSGIIWASGLGSGFVTGLNSVFGFLFNSSWSGSFWGNLLFVLVIAVVIAVALQWNPFKNSKPYIKVK
jgi:hypothetical protein